VSDLLDDESLRGALERLHTANRQVAEAYPGERADRQPVHTVYGGAQLFTHDVAAKLGEAALRLLEEHAPDSATFARALGMSADGELAPLVHARVIEKLRHEPVEDYRIDFEDGYGVRPDAEEDGHAAAAAAAMARGALEQTLPPFVGIRIKPLTDELHARSLRTLEIFVRTLLERTRGALPRNFVVTLAKITAVEQVSVLVEAFELLERSSGLLPGALLMEFMVETPQMIVGPDGRCPLLDFVHAARGRCRGAHFGVYDYTAACGVAAAHQGLRHPACDFARHVMQVALAGSGVTLSDGATNVLPIAPHGHRADASRSPAEREANRAAIHSAWRTHVEDTRHSLRHGFYQGWDMHPGQLPARYAAVYAFYLEARAQAVARLAGFIEKATQATLLGNVFDDAATGQALLNFLLRGISCGALAEDDARAAGLTLEELRERSFMKILNARREVRA
jgi:hypothetical protein